MIRIIRDGLAYYREPRKLKIESIPSTALLYDMATGHTINVSDLATYIDKHYPLEKFNRFANPYQQKYLRAQKLIYPTRYSTAQDSSL